VVRQRDTPPARAGGPAAHAPFGGRLCLDFANTVNGRLTAAPEELLADVADLASWGQRMGLLPAAAAARLAAARDEGAACVARATALREVLYRVFAAVATGARPAETDVRWLERSYLTALRRVRLLPGGPGAGWRWAPLPADDPVALAWLTWPVTRSAVDLLTSAEELPRLKRCAGADRGCAGLFLDETRNGIRRWCRMDDCGSRAKMRRLYARRRDARSTG
jgi:predicted RNA-binding Zn ribbon-like protein